MRCTSQSCRPVPDVEPGKRAPLVRPRFMRRVHFFRRPPAQGGFELNGAAADPSPCQRDVRFAAGPLGRQRPVSRLREDWPGSRLQVPPVFVGGARLIKAGACLGRASCLFQLHPRVLQPLLLHALSPRESAPCVRRRNQLHAHRGDLEHSRRHRNAHGAVGAGRQRNCLPVLRRWQQPHVRALQRTPSCSGLTLCAGTAKADGWGACTRPSWTCSTA